MADDRNRTWDFPGNSFGNDDRQDYGRDYGSGRDYNHSSARNHDSAGRLGREDRNFRGGGTGYGGERGRDSGGDRGYYGGRDQDRDYRGSYASDGYRFAETDRDRGADRGGYDRGNFDRGNFGRGQQGYGRPPEGYRYQDRGFIDRAGDEVRSWFGDEDAERRREFDQRFDERTGSSARDADYHGWRRGQIEALDRDYDEYRRENATKFDNEFGVWRTDRQTQRTSLSQVTEHMEVVGSDGQHVGTVDKVRGDRIVLTKTDADAGGRHHSIPSRWIQSVDDKLTIRKTADEAKSHWRDEERSGAMFGEDSGRGSGDGKVNLNRSFSGTY